MRHKFVEHIPSEIEEGILYISIEYDVAKHKCACGCGDDIVTTLSPARWQLTYDGETVSLSPSIGNWTHDCKSHYFIRNNKIKWANSFNEAQISNVIRNDKEALKKHIEGNSEKKGFINWIKKYFS